MDELPVEPKVKADADAMNAGDCDCDCDVVLNNKEEADDV